MVSAANHAGLEVEEHRAGHSLAARGLVVKHVNAAEVTTIGAAGNGLGAKIKYLRRTTQYCGDNDAHLGRINVFDHESSGGKYVAAPRGVLLP
jgi:hypothetical protein